MTGVLSFLVKAFLPFSVELSLCRERRLLHPSATRPPISASASLCVRQVSSARFNVFLRYGLCWFTRQATCDLYENKISSFSTAMHTLSVPMMWKAKQSAIWCYDVIPGTSGLVNISKNVEFSQQTLARVNLTLSFVADFSHWQCVEYLHTSITWPRKRGKRSWICW